MIAGGCPASLDARCRSMSIAPRHLNEHVPGVAIARLGDRAEVQPPATGGVSHDEAHMTGELARAREARPVAHTARQAVRETGAPRDHVGRFVPLHLDFSHREGVLREHDQRALAAFDQHQCACYLANAAPDGA
jgi:hypothetical protein